MPDDEDNDVDLRDVEPDPEMLESATLGCIEMLRRKRICLYPRRHKRGGRGDIKDFWDCFDYLGDCDALIFCAPHHGKKEARARICYCVNSGDFDLIIDCRECVGVDGDWVTNWRHDLLFPNQADNLLVDRADPKQLMRPPEDQFWGHYVVLGMVRWKDNIHTIHKIHLLYLGLRGDFAWPYFLAPNRIQVARTITSP